MHTREEKIEALGRVIDTLDILRVKCPWDAKQTNESLRPNTIEEVYELCDALINSEDINIRKELGDVLLHVLFYSKIGEEKGAFDIADVCDALNTKLVYRHPHVFGDAQCQLHRRCAPELGGAEAQGEGRQQDCPLGCAQGSACHDQGRPHPGEGRQRRL